MKTIFKYLTILIISLFLFHFSFLGFNFFKSDFIVHEWGTFSSIVDKNGKQVSGQRLEGGTSLPKEVYRLVDKTTNRRHSRKIDSGYSIEYGKEDVAFEGINIQNDTIRMETPVLYFYSEKEIEIQVDVKFPNGSIGEWFPNRQNGELISEDYLEFSSGKKEPNNSKKILDLKNYTGFISWKAKILEPKNKSTLTINTNATEWIHPRETESNLVQRNNEIEKYIFYRGIANFENPILTKLQSNKKEKFLVLKNLTNEKIPFVFVLKNDYQNKKKLVYWSGNMTENQNIKLNLNDKEAKEFSETHILEFKKALEQAGLFPKEAEAMMNTWKKSYFEKQFGLTVFYIVPENKLNQLLPINFSVKPDEFKRAFIGRIKIDENR